MCAIAWFEIEFELEGKMINDKFNLTPMSFRIKLEKSQLETTLK